jgi:hypothetical protein
MQLDGKDTQRNLAALDLPGEEHFIEVWLG